MDFPYVSWALSSVHGGTGAGLRRCNGRLLGGCGDGFLPLRPSPGTLLADVSVVESVHDRAVAAGNTVRNLRCPRGGRFLPNRCGSPSSILTALTATGVSMLSSRWGTCVDPETVRSIMRELGLMACQPRPFRPITTIATDAGSLPDLVVGDFDADRPGVKLVGDITYIRTGEGLVVSRDRPGLFLQESRRIRHGRSYADRTRRRRTAHGGRKYCRRRGCHVIHSDRGAQCLSAEFASAARSVRVLSGSSHPGDHRTRVLVKLDTLHHGVLDTEQPLCLRSPYFQRSETSTGQRRALFARRSWHPWIRLESPISPRLSSRSCSSATSGTSPVLRGDPRRPWRVRQAMPRPPAGGYGDGGSRSGECTLLDVENTRVAPSYLWDPPAVPALAVCGPGRIPQQ